MENHLTVNRLSDACSVLFLPAFADITHTGRHTFSTVVTLANNVSLENVAKMLGHTSIRMTQRYAKVLDSSILRDMQGVRETLAVE